MTSIQSANERVLRLKAKPVPKKDFGSRKLAALLSAMSDALAKEKNGVALAAPQIGHSVRIFIVSRKVLEQERLATDAAPKEKGDLVFINPEVLRSSRKKELMHEGCLSVPGLYGWVKRHEKTTVRAYTAAGVSFTYHGSGLMSQIFQHEMDHLDGVLFTDRAERYESNENG